MEWDYCGLQYVTKGRFQSCTYYAVKCFIHDDSMLKWARRGIIVKRLLFRAYLMLVHCVRYLF